MTNLVYIFYASGEPQPWNFPSFNKTGDEPMAVEETDGKENKSYVLEDKFTDPKQ